MNVRTIFGVLAWMMSSTLDASDVGSLVAISSDGNPTTYLLSDVQRIELNANDTEGTMSVIGKNGYEEGEYKKILFASTTTSASGEEVPRIYIYPNPVTNSSKNNDYEKVYTFFTFVVKYFSFDLCSTKTLCL